MHPDNGSDSISHKPIGKMGGRLEEDDEDKEVLGMSELSSSCSRFLCPQPMCMHTQLASSAPGPAAQISAGSGPRILTTFLSSTFPDVSHALNPYRSGGVNGPHPLYLLTHPSCGKSPGQEPRNSKMRAFLFLTFPGC